MEYIRYDRQVWNKFVFAGCGTENGIFPLFSFVPIEGALDGHSSHFSYYRRSPEGICSHLSTFHREMGLQSFRSLVVGWNIKG